MICCLCNKCNSSTAVVLYAYKTFDSVTAIENCILSVERFKYNVARKLYAESLIFHILLLQAHLHDVLVFFFLLQTSLGSERDYESLVLMRMRQAAERQKLIEQMQREDEEEEAAKT